MRRAAASCSRGAPQGSGACPDRRGFGPPLQRQRWEAVSCNLSTAAASPSYPGAKLDLFNQEEAFGRAAVPQPAGEGDGGPSPFALHVQPFVSGRYSHGWLPKTAEPSAFRHGQ